MLRLIMNTPEAETARNDTNDRNGGFRVKFEESRGFLSILCSPREIRVKSKTRPRCVQNGRKDGEVLVFYTHISELVQTPAMGPP